MYQIVNPQEKTSKQDTKKDRYKNFNFGNALE